MQNSWVDQTTFGLKSLSVMLDAVAENRNMRRADEYLPCATARLSRGTSPRLRYMAEYNLEANILASKYHRACQDEEN